MTCKNNKLLTLITEVHVHKSGIHLTVFPPVRLVLSQRVMELISSALSDPLSPVEDNTEQTVCLLSYLLLVDFKYATAEVENLFVLWCDTVTGG